MKKKEKFVCMLAKLVVRAVMSNYKNLLSSECLYCDNKIEKQKIW